MNVDPSQPYILTIADVLSPAECRELIERIDREGPGIATVNTLSGPRVRPSVRNNERVIFDDEALAGKLFERVRSRVPQEVHGMTLVGANERFRCYRYKPGMHFAPHSDASFQRSDNEQSWYSFLVYLNGGFDGGQTTFFVEPEVSIEPRAGLALLFQHEIPHEGSEVKAGVKYVARTDLMYRRRVTAGDSTPSNR